MKRVCIKKGKEDFLLPFPFIFLLPFKELRQNFCLKSEVWNFRLNYIPWCLTVCRFKTLWNSQKKNMALSQVNYFFIVSIGLIIGDLYIIIHVCVCLCVCVTLPFWQDNPMFMSCFLLIPGYARAASPFCWRPCFGLCPSVLLNFFADGSV